MKLMIFTDLLGGSIINNSAVSVLMRHRNVFVVAGINPDSAAGVSVQKKPLPGRDYLRHQRGA